MTVNRIEPMSLARILGLLNAALGLLLGAMFSLFFFTMSSVVFPMTGPAPFAAFRVLFGGGAIIILPLLYGAMGFIGGLISAAIYNGLAKAIGGVVIEVSTAVGQG